MKRTILPLLIAAFTLSFALFAQAEMTQLSDSRPGYYTAQTQIPILDTPGPLKTLAQSTYIPWARKAQRAFIQQSQQTFRAQGKPRYPYQYQATGKITHHSARLLGVLFDTLQDTGGAHPTSAFTTFNLGIMNGNAKVLHLADLFRPGLDYKTLVSNAVIAKLKHRAAATEVVNGQVTSMTADQLERFAAVSDGLLFYFNAGEVGPDVSGRFKVKLTVAELGPMFRRGLLFAQSAD